MLLEMFATKDSSCCWFHFKATTDRLREGAPAKCSSLWDSDDTQAASQPVEGSVAPGHTPGGQCQRPAAPSRFLQLPRRRPVTGSGPHGLTARAASLCACCLVLFCSDPQAVVERGFGAPLSQTRPRRPRKSRAFPRSRRPRPGAQPPAALSCNLKAETNVRSSERCFLFASHGRDLAGVTCHSGDSCVIRTIRCPSPPNPHSSSLPWEGCPGSG